MNVARTLAAACVLLSSLAHADIEGAKLYTGPEGMKVTLVRQSGEPAILMYVQGSDSHYDGKVLPVTVEEYDGRMKYGTQRAGREVYPFHAVTSGGRRSYTFYLPGGAREVSLAYDEAGSQALRPEEVLQRYEAQKKDGTLARFMDFNRAAEQASAQEGVSERVKQTQQKCGGHLFPLEVKWATVTDDFLKHYNVASFCGAPLEALAALCESPSARELLVANIKSVECVVGAQLQLSVEGGVARWTTSVDGSNQETFARGALEDAFGGKAPGEPPEGAPAWGKGQSLRELQAVDRTSVCTDGNRYFAVLAPGEQRGQRIYSGKGNVLVEAPDVPWGLSGMFFEPRYPNPRMNPHFRGADLRVYSALEVDREKQSCKLRCGTRELQLQLLPPAQARGVLVGAKIEQGPLEYRPYALLRDDTGRYYFIDKGARRDNERSFRVFVGQKGQLEPQKLTNLVADSLGEVFSTKKGELRLVVNRGEGSSWTQAKKKLELRSVPLEENLPLIYNELGVYQGLRLGTPCDDAPL